MSYQAGLFWLLVVLVVQPFRLRLAALAFLLIAHVDMSGPAFDSAGQVGWQNAFKALVLPVWLMFVTSRVLAKQGRTRLTEIVVGMRRSFFTIVWLLFVAYVGLAVLWSPFPLAGLKLLMALVSHTLVFVTLLLLWLSDRLDARVVLLAFVLALGIGYVQTVVMDNPFGTGENVTFPRFTTFSGPQSFAENLVSLGAVLVWAPSGVVTRLGAIGLLLGVAFGAGSRIGFLGAVAAVGVWLARRLDLRRVLVGLAMLAAVGGLLALPAVRGPIVDSRVGEGLSVVRDGLEGIEAVGTFRWRADLYSCLWQQALSRGPVPTMFGSGTAGIAGPGLVCQPDWQGRFSPNRVAHNEFLRVLYDQGVLGLGLGLLLLAGVVVQALRGFVHSAEAGNPRAWHLGPMASAVPILLLALSFDTLLQGALSAGALGLLLVISQAAAARWRGRQLAIYSEETFRTHPEETTR